MNGKCIINESFTNSLRIAFIIITCNGIGIEVQLLFKKNEVIYIKLRRSRD